MTGWKQNMGMSEDVALVKSYVPDQVKETWKQEADEQGVSLSKYVSSKVEQARAQQQVPQTSNTEEVEKLQQRIAELEDQLDEARAQNPEASATVSILDDGAVKQNLSHRCKTLEELLRELVEDVAVDQLIREPVETRLYELAAEKEVEFQRGAGWRLTGGDRR